MISSRGRWRLPIRLKILILISGTLVLTLAGYLYLGSSVIIEDKSSYVYDFNSSALEGVSAEVQKQLEDAHRAARLLGRFLGPATAAGTDTGPAVSRTDSLARAFQEASANQSLVSLIYLRAEAGGRFTIEQAFGMDGDAGIALLNGQGWSPAFFERLSSPFVIGQPAGDAVIPLGGKVLDAGNGTLAYLATIRLDAGIFQSLPRDSSGFLLDAQGRVLLSRPNPEVPVDASRIESLERSLPSESRIAGAREWNAGDRRYLASYRRIMQDKAVLISLVPYSLVLQAGRSLIRESLRIGLGILLMAFSVAFFWAAGITFRIRQIWFATQRVSEGDFTLRIGADHAVLEDEVSDLAASFDLMSAKINLLMSENIEKGRMEKELETAQALQANYFPRAGFLDANIQLAGSYLPASECAGDWWHFARIGDELLVFIGDVTGHGVSAALVTAQVHGAVAQWILDRQCLGIKDGRDLAGLLDKLNLMLFNTFGRHQSMTLLAMALGLASGQLTVFNCSHPWPYLHRPKPGLGNPGAGRIYDRLAYLKGSSSPALGISASFSCTPFVVQLLAGDSLVLYTDGLSDLRDEKTTRLRRAEILERLLSAIEAGGSDARRVCDGIVGSLRPNLEQRQPQSSDDVTIVVATVAASAVWGRSGPYRPEASPRT